MHELKPRAPLKGVITYASAASYCPCINPVLSVHRVVDAGHPCYTVWLCQKWKSQPRASSRQDPPDLLAQQGVYLSGKLHLSPKLEVVFIMGFAVTITWVQTSDRLDLASRLVLASRLYLQHNENL